MSPPEGGHYDYGYVVSAGSYVVSAFRRTVE